MSEPTSEKPAGDDIPYRPTTRNQPAYREAPPQFSTPPSRTEDPGTKTEKNEKEQEGHDAEDAGDLGPPDTEIMIIGHSRSGKTALLAALHHAVMENLAESCGFSFSVEGESPELIKLCERFKYIPIVGRLEGGSTTEYTLHEMTLHYWQEPKNSVSAWLQKKKWRKPAVNTIYIKAPDYPGGALESEEKALSDSTEPLEDHVIAMREIRTRLPTATGLIICLPEDGTSYDTNQRFIRKVDSLLNEIPDRSSLLRFVVFVLTKIDSHAATRLDGSKFSLLSEWRNARQSLDEASDKASLQTRLKYHGVTNAFIENLNRRSNTRIHVAAGRTSIYGFTTAGFFNWDPDFKGLLIRPHDGDPNVPMFSRVQVAHEWKPFRVIDPFLFAAQGILIDGRNFKQVYEEITSRHKPGN